METRKRMFTEGLIAGVIGYAAIAAFFVVTNFALGRPLLATARALGNRLVDPAVAETVPLAPVLAYNGLHLAILLAIGTGVSWLVYETEHHPRLWFLTFLVGVLGIVVSEAFFLIFAQPGIDSLPVWSIIGANLLAGLAVGTYFLRVHRQLLRQIEELGPDAL